MPRHCELRLLFEGANSLINGSCRARLTASATSTPTTRRSGIVFLEEGQKLAFPHKMRSRHPFFVTPTNGVEPLILMVGATGFETWFVSQQVAIGPNSFIILITDYVASLQAVSACLAGMLSRNQPAPSRSASLRRGARCRGSGTARLLWNDPTATLFLPVAAMWNVTRATTGGRRTLTSGYVARNYGLLES